MTMKIHSLIFVAVVLTEVLHIWTGSYADRSTDQSSFAETHPTVIYGQILHTSHIGLPGDVALRENTI